jgi:hypothetical protein
MAKNANEAVERSPGWAGTNFGWTYDDEVAEACNYITSFPFLSEADFLPE